MNRLADATSPYLRQHADNPVDWWPWCDEAFDTARRRNVPVLLSVGYSSCHWCHVMARESFEDDSIAALINEQLVPVKVDREERPDVDSVYMAATQAMTRRGGWPMTAFLTPDREPFHCGTYYPPEPFRQLILAVARAWRDDRGAVEDGAGRIAAALAASEGRDTRYGGQPGAGRPDFGQLAVAAVGTLASEYDAPRGGFGGAPKFPPSTALEFLLRYSWRAAPDGGGGGDGGGDGASTPANALDMAAGTLEAMARGGIYDQLAGGFARYSTDAAWIVPHFEKMLYDNALLAGVYAHWWRRTGSPLARRIAIETCEWLLAEMTTPEGGFGSALDADSGGSEGAFYVWTPAALTAALGQRDAAYASEVFAVTARGNFERGSSVLRLPADPEDGERYAAVRSALAAVRAARTRPARDDKVVAGWNGLAIGALARAGLLAGRQDFVTAATAAAELLARVHLNAGRLARTSRDGAAGPGAGVLEDYACVADGFLTLAGVTGDSSWLGMAGDLLDSALDHFEGENGSFADTADDSESLIYRPADPADGPAPAGSSALAGALLSYAALTGSARYQEAAVTALSGVPRFAVGFPRAAGWGLAVAEAMRAGPLEIAIVGPPGDPAASELLLTAAQAAPPGAVLARGGGSGDDGVPLLAGRGLVNGRPAAYVCRDFACQLPVTTPAELRALLSGG